MFWSAQYECIGNFFVTYSSTSTNVSIFSQPQTRDHIVQWIVCMSYPRRKCVRIYMFCKNASYWMPLPLLTGVEFSWLAKDIQKWFMSSLKRCPFCSHMAVPGGITSIVHSLCFANGPYWFQGRLVTVNKAEHLPGAR